MLAIALSALLLAPLSSPQEAEPGYAYASQEETKIHAFFRDDSPVVALLEIATPLRVVEVRTPWALVRVPGGIECWVHGDYVTIGDDGLTGIVNAERVRARPLPSTGADSYPIGMFRRDNQVMVLEIADGWMRVVAPETLAAWVRLDAIEQIEEVPEGWDASWDSAIVGRDDLHDRAREAAEQRRLRAAAEKVLADQYESLARELQQQKDAPDLATDLTPVLEGLRAIVAETTSDQLRLDAERSLAQAEALHAVIAGTEGLITQRQELAEKQRQAQEALHAREVAAREAAARWQGVLESYDATGWIRPNAGGGLRHMLVVGDRTIPVVPPGRIDLADYVDVEVAIRGLFRNSGVHQTTVLQVETLRVVAR